jgi:outer membrane protein assembly factor BamE (lipoprotein component of BamABCDE complex)
MKKSILIAALIATSACTQNHSARLHSTEDREMTVGIVQREIRAGMSQADVALALGSPNIVSKDSSGRESWIYDKIATEASFSRSSGGAGFLGAIGGMAGSVLLLGIPSVNYQEESGADAVSQRTLTVVIKFDHKGMVEQATYHSSRF